MKPVRQFYDNDPDILCHGKEHFSQIFSLDFYFIRIIRKLSQFGNSVYQQGNFFSEFFLDLLICHDSIFHNIMQQTCHDSFFIHFQLRQNDRHIQRMNDIRFSRLAHLACMGLIRNPVSFLHHRYVL